MLNLIFLNECNSKNNYIAMEERLLAIDENELKNWMTDLSPVPSPAWATLRGETSQVYQGYMNIDHIHEQVVNMWVHGAPHWVGSSVWTAAHEGGDHTNYDTPPPWNPTLQDVEDLITEETELDPFYGRPLDGYYRDWEDGTLVKILQYRGRYNVDLNSPLLGEHITYIYSLCNEFERQLQSGVVFRSASSHFQLDTDEDEDENEDEDDLIEPAESPYTEEEWRQIDASSNLVRNPPHNVSVSTSETTNNLCSEGVTILDRIMDTMDTDTRELNEGDYLTLMNLFRDLHT
jgi:hypothetical protein